jgi:hypothetical protein
MYCPKIAHNAVVKNSANSQTVMKLRPRQRPPVPPTDPRKVYKVKALLSAVTTTKVDCRNIFTTRRFCLEYSERSCVFIMVLYTIGLCFGGNVV